MDTGLLDGLGKDARLGLGDAPVLVGVATPHRLVEGGILATHDPLTVAEHHRDADLGLAFLAVVIARQSAERLVKDPAGGFVLKFDRHPRNIAVNGLFRVDAARREQGGEGGSEGYQVPV